MTESTAVGGAADVVPPMRATLYRRNAWGFGLGTLGRDMAPGGDVPDRLSHRGRSGLQRGPGCGHGRSGDEARYAEIITDLRLRESTLGAPDEQQ